MLTAETMPARSVETMLALITSRWKTLIIRDLLDGGPRRFSELERSVGGVSQKMLTQSLRQMEEDGFVTRTVFAEVPPRVECELTPLGQSLHIILDAMEEWGEGYQRQVRKSA